MYAVCMNGKGCFYQWDTGQVITLRDTGEVTEVHFAHKGDERALSVLTRTVGSSIEADVPNILLQSDADLLVYLVCKDENGTETRKAIRIPVIARPKPESYVYTETEVLNYTNLVSRLDQIEENGVSDERIAAALEDYLKDNPITGDGGLSITDDGNGNVTVKSTGSVTITDDGEGNVTIA